MKLAYPEINSVISIKEGNINSVIIESPHLLYRFVNDMKIQLGKQDGNSILSVNDEIVEISKHVHLLTDIYGINLNNKNIISKVVDDLSKRAMEVEYFEESMQIMSKLQNYLENLLFEYDCDFECAEIHPKQIIKAMGICIVDDASSLEDRILNYVNLIREFYGEKLFIFVNFRSFIEQKNFELLSETLLEHNYKVLFIDSKDFPLLKFENRLTIDIDLCEF